MKKSTAKFMTMFIKDKEKKDFIYEVLTNKSKMHFYKDTVKNTSNKNQSNLMQTGYNIKGVNNKVIIIENGIERDLRDEERIAGLEIKVNGNNNLIKLELPIMSRNSLIQIGTDKTPNDDVIVEIGTTTRFWNVWIECTVGRKQQCKIGRHTTISGVGFALNDEYAGCIIGEDCKFSNSIRIFGSDGHTILDKNTNEVINTPTSPIIIGDHCWVGEAVRITKNARIGNHCIVGGGSVACKDYKESNVIIAGNPGKIVKRNITWNRKAIFHYKNIKKESAYE